MKPLKVTLLIVVILASLMSAYCVCKFLYIIYTPDLTGKIYAKYGNMETSELIHKIEGHKIKLFEEVVAVQVLRMRKSKEAVPVLINLLKREIESTRLKEEIIHALGDIGDERAIPVLKGTIDSGKEKDSDEYWYAIIALSKIGVEEMRGIALKKLNNGETLHDYSLHVLINVGRKEDLELLKRLKAVSDGENINARLDGRLIDKVIDSIERKNID